MRQGLSNSELADTATPASQLVLGILSLLSKAGIAGELLH